MRSFVVLLLLTFLGTQLRAQCPLKYFIYGSSVDSIEGNIDSMYARMDTLKTHTYRLIQKFNQIRDLRDDDSLNSDLGSLIRENTETIGKLKPLLDSPYRRDHLRSGDSAKYDQSCFYYRTNKEIEDFKYSLELLDSSMNHLFANKDSLIGTVTGVRFLNSYYYMSTCRSLLLARMNNLENEIVLFRPYIRFRDDSFKYGIAHPVPRSDDFYSKNHDKITTATDAMMEQTRRGPRNWFLKSLAGGATGAAIVVGILTLFKWHK